MRRTCGVFMTSYPERWRMACALKQPCPTSETGDVAPEASTSAANSSVPTFSPAGIKAAFENMAMTARISLMVGAALIVGGTAGYFIGKA
jgi:hypothetical protein